jgi:hypothetical protein
MTIPVIYPEENRRRQSSKWDGVCRYNVPELLFVPEIHTGTYQYIFFFPQALIVQDGPLASLFRVS